MAPMYYFEEELFMLLPALLGSIPSGLFAIASYILTAMALYTAAKRRGLRKPWLAWIPVMNIWILGSLSDQYQYVVRGQNKSKRKALLTLKILSVVFAVAIVVLAVTMLGSAVMSGMYGAHGMDILMRDIMGPLLAVVGLALPLAGIGIAVMVIRYMALYDIYRSMDPANAVLFLILSVLFSPTEPFFLFFSRSKDEGMPPRKQPQPEYSPQNEPASEYWEAEPEENKDYL